MLFLYLFLFSHFSNLSHLLHIFHFRNLLKVFLSSRDISFSIRFKGMAENWINYTELSSYAPNSDRLFIVVSVEGKIFEVYFHFSCSIRSLPPNQYLL